MPHIRFVKSVFYKIGSCRRNGRSGRRPTAAHVFCAQRRLRGEGLPGTGMIWLDSKKLAWRQKALADRDIAASVAAHKAAFFREKDASENWVDYSVAVAGGMRLVPDGEARLALADDYARMVQSGWLLGPPPRNLSTC